MPSSRLLRFTASKPEAKIRIAKREWKAFDAAMKWLNPLNLIEKWISEHGSAAILREHNAVNGG